MLTIVWVISHVHHFIALWLLCSCRASPDLMAPREGLDHKETRDFLAVLDPRDPREHKERG